MKGMRATCSCYDHKGDVIVDLQVVRFSKQSDSEADEANLADPDSVTWMQIRNRRGSPHSPLLQQLGVELEVQDPGNTPILTSSPTSSPSCFRRTWQRKLSSLAHLCPELGQPCTGHWYQLSPRIDDHAPCTLFRCRSMSFLVAKPRCR